MQKLILIAILLLSVLFSSKANVQYLSSQKFLNELNRILKTDQPIIQTNPPSANATPLPSSPFPNDQVLGSETTLFTVTKVVDGDTIHVTAENQTYTLRFIGIDTPETVDPRKPQQCFGKEASQKTSELLLGLQVTLEKDVSEVDRYGRLLRYVYKDGKLINEQLVAEGFAFAKSYPPDIKYQSKLTKAQEFAQQSQLGLWKPGVCPVQ